MKKAEFKATKNYKLSTRSSVIENATADIYFIHGLGEHCQRYFNEANYFNSLGLNFYTYDQRTHGESDGVTRTFINDFDDYVNDFREFLKITNTNDRDFFLMAHSMGGLVLLTYLLEVEDLSQNFKGALFSSPLIMPKKDMAPILQKLSPIIAAIFPKLKTVGIDPKHISRDPKEQDSYVQDPLNYSGGVYAKTANSLLKQMKKVKKLFATFNVPFLIQHGTDDQLAEFLGSQTLFERSPSKDKTFVPLEGYRHEITRELNHEVVLKSYGDWMLERL